MGLAGFLLFQVQPMLAKFILPWFGGSAATWKSFLTVIGPAKEAVENLLHD